MVDRELEFDSYLGRLLGKAAKAFRHRMEQSIAQAGYDVSSIQAIFLAFISEKDGISQQELAETLYLEKTAVTRIIDALEKRNFAIRVKDKSDRRQNMVYVTSEGKDMMEQLRPVAMLIENQALQGIDDEKVRVCKEVLRHIRRNLSE